VNRVFIEVYLDEDVNVLVGELLAASGFDVLTTRDAAQVGRSDAEQLDYATRHRRAIVTHNRLHFESLALDYFTGGRRHAGIIIAVQRPPQQIARRLLTILNQMTADEMEDQVRYV